LTKKKVAIILPSAHSGGVWDYAKYMTERLIDVYSSNPNFEIVVAILDHVANQNKFSEILEKFPRVLTHPGSVRAIKLKNVDLAFINQLSAGIKSNSLIDKKYTLFDDGFTFLLDCSFWFLLSLQDGYEIPPIVPFCSIPHDTIPRHVPEIFGCDFSSGYWGIFLENIRTIQNAEFMISINPETDDDYVGYFGVRRNKIINLPLFLPLKNFQKVTAYVSNKPYFIWVTNCTLHKNQARTLQALQLYYTKCCGCFEVFIISGDAVRWESMFLMQYKNSGWRENVHLLDFVTEKEFLEYIKGAKFVLHSVLNDNGTSVAIEAKIMGIPTLSSDYKQMHFLNESLGLNMSFFDPMDIEDMAKKIKLMEWYDYQKENKYDFTKFYNEEEVKKLYKKKLAQLLSRYLR